MSGRLARLAAGTAASAGLLAMAVAGPAYAATGRITGVTSEGRTLRVVFSGEALAAGATIDPGTVAMTVAGRPVDAHATTVDGGSLQRTAVLVIDTSQSMRGEGIAGAKSAAAAFVGAVPADVAVGLVAFADKPSVKVAPTTDRGAVLTAVNALRPGGETALYDGVELGLRTAGRGGVRSLLLLSDGADTKSRTTLADLVDATKSSGVLVDAVAFKTPGATSQVLGRIATGGGGRLVNAGRASDIAGAFSSAARSLSTQLVVTADVPADLAGQEVDVVVTAKAGTETLTDESRVTLAAALASAQPTGPVPYRAGGGSLGSKGTLTVALAALFAGLAGILALGTGSLSRGGKGGRVRRRLSFYTLTGRAAPEVHETTALGDSAVARSAVELAGRVVRRRDLETGLAQRLERASVPLRPAEWLLVHAGVTVGLGLLFLLLSGGSLLTAIFGMVVGFALPYAYLSIKASRRKRAFLGQVPDTLQLLAGSLSAGYSFPQAVDAVVREGSPPVSAEFNRAMIESRLGVPIEDALDHVATRMDSRDFAWVVMAVRIQREVGGNLSEVLTTVAQTMRERERVRRQVSVLSAEGRLSAYILGGLPPVFATYLLLVQPTYVKVLFTDPIGLALLAVMGVLFAVGVFWLRRVVKVEV
ncbi:MAG: tight adherence protein [Frankiaceae bacterium]|jgi:tight adherence protein B|nr:tight adherence protein [Frankiaceae bacterium]